MARGNEPLIARLWPGGLALGFIAILVGAALAALLAAAPTLDLPALLGDRYLRAVVVFTLAQAAASTLLSVGLGLPVARALARRERFPGRALLLRLLGLPLVMPTIVAILGIVAVYGRSGWLNRAVAGAGLPPLALLYGWGGVLIGHVFFNLPLAVRLMLPAWQGVPGEIWRTAAQLGMGSGAIFRLIEWPLLRQVIPGIAGLVFMLCFASFAVVLTLGGGPAATTLEVAIYQALRFDFDPARAVILALLQLLLCALLVGLGQAWARAAPLPATVQRAAERPDLGGALGRLADGAAILLAALFVGLPLLALLLAGAGGPLAASLSDAALWRAAGRSLAIALAAAALAGLLGAALAAAGRTLRLRAGRPRAAAAIELAGALVLVVSPLALGAGLFLLLRPVTDVFALAPALVVLINGLMALPYVLRLLAPALAREAELHDRLCASLGMAGWDRFRLAAWPALRRPLGLALGLAAALSTGDLGAIALFGTQDTQTLPLLLYQQMGSYRSGPAAVTALLLLGLCLGLFWLLERGVGGREPA
jgi:thiamine transport system permease protein